MSPEGNALRRGRRLWAITLVLVLVALVYQRYTGPTYPYRTTIDLGGGQTVRARLVRSGDTFEDARVAVPSPGGVVTGTLYWRRYRAREDWHATPLVPATTIPGGQVNEIAGALPRQPPAGKIEYRLDLTTPAGRVQVPSAPDSYGDNLLMRFKDHVPVGVLVPHVFMMFVSLLAGVRACLGVLFGVRGWPRLVLVTAVCLTIGGMVLGPIVQKYAFGAYWTGFPFGTDLTDNKTAVAWLAWVLAAASVVRFAEGHVVQRALVVVATILMLAVYVIPHSLRGSELDYTRLDSLQQQHKTIDPRKAIGTSDR